MKERCFFIHSKIELNFDEILKSIQYKDVIRINSEKFEEILEFSLRLFENDLTVFLIMPNEREALEAYMNLREYSNKIFNLPSHDVLPFELISSSINERAKRVFSLFNLGKQNSGIYISSLEGALQKTFPPNRVTEMYSRVKIRDEITEKFFDKLRIFGYERVETVRKLGEMARRGFIIDFFSPSYEKPVRLELFDNEVIDIRFFDPDTQRSTNKAKDILILPVHEYLLNDESLENLKKEIENIKRKFPESHTFLEKLMFDFSSLDTLTGIFYRDAACLVDFAEKLQNSVVILKDPARSLKDFYSHKGAVLDLYGKPFFIYMYHRYSKSDPQRLLQSRIPKIFIARKDEEVDFEYSKEFDLGISKGKLRIKSKKLPDFLKFPTKTIEDWEEIEKGDYVVHKDYGIGKFLGIKKITNQFGTREYFELLYDQGVKLYVPVERMYRLHRYIGNVEGIKLGNLKNNGQWQRTKRKVRKEIEKKVKELLEMYALRHKITKVPSLGDQELEYKFFESFPHVETEDQLRATEEIFKDMADIKPMDRLLCGDSGAGKTEVAMRAAFRAIASGKQVAFLVPTTVLAKQHYLNFKDRMERFGVRVELLDRLKTQKEVERILNDLKKGTVDMVIGTHRLLSNDVKFKNLGLVIIDEEQRFGVIQKEKLKKQRLSVDVLSLSATPIPRTLYMSLSGMKDISLIENMPPGRVPVEILVSKYDDRIIKTAVLRELSRGGQIIYIHNRVGELGSIYLRLKKLVPELKAGIVHGQMRKKEFDSVISDFYDGKIDLLLSTTIVENGIDIPNANTLIVDDAHRYGLAQLYQIRGRVGRSNRRAFAYFLYPANERLTKEATKRLRAIKEFDKPGGGFKLSLKDMEIRGIGNVLGFEQHGHINSIGLYMYREILENVLKKYKGEITYEKSANTTDDVELNGFKIDILIPQDYITSSFERMKIYRRIAETTTIEDIEDIRKELRDRFGKLPRAIENLLIYAKIKVLASKLGIEKINLKDNFLMLKFKNKMSVEKFHIASKIGIKIDNTLRIYNFNHANPEKRLLELLDKGGTFECSIR